jgi:hypothetical protein
VLIFMLLLVNKKDLMGEFTNTPLYNVIAWITTAIMITLSILLIWTSRGQSQFYTTAAWIAMIGMIILCIALLWTSRRK